MFDTLNDKFEKIVRSIRGKAVISESDLDATMREIRIALLEADVALIVVKEFIDKVKEKILGQEVLKSVKADQMIIKLVQDELVTILGSENQPLNIKSSVLTKILLCGLQGSGKTTTIAKLAKHLLNNSKKKIPAKSLGESDGKPVTVQSGRYGPYVQLGKIRATLPKDENQDSITLERALELIAVKAAKGTTKKKTKRKTSIG